MTGVFTLTSFSFQTRFFLHCLGNQACASTSTVQLFSTLFWTFMCSMGCVWQIKNNFVSVWGYLDPDFLLNRWTRNGSKMHFQNLVFRGLMDRNTCSLVNKKFVNKNTYAHIYASIYVCVCWIYITIQENHLMLGISFDNILLFPCFFKTCWFHRWFLA